MVSELYYQFHGISNSRTYQNIALRENELINNAHVIAFIITFCGKPYTTRTVYVQIVGTQFAMRFVGIISWPINTLHLAEFYSCF